MTKIFALTYLKLKCTIQQKWKGHIQKIYKSRTTTWPINKITAERGCITGGLSLHSFTTETFNTTYKRERNFTRQQKPAIKRKNAKNVQISCPESMNHALTIKVSVTKFLVLDDNKLAFPPRSILYLSDCGFHAVIPIPITHNMNFNRPVSSYNSSILLLIMWSRYSSLAR